jgi:cation diffusion facilitator CzcD-associated flavoprotein CzcO
VLVRIAVIGAGPHGLSALKALLQNGIDAQAFEREADLGGNWNYGAQTSRVYRSTHLISSKPFTQFPDFPMPDGYPDYPSHFQVKEYFTSYARHFGLVEHIRFDSEVVSVAPVGDGAIWTVTVRDRHSGDLHVEEFDGGRHRQRAQLEPEGPPVPRTGVLRRRDHPLCRLQGR